MAAELPEVAAPRDDAPAKPETQPDADVGLTNTEAGRRLRLGQGNAVTRSTSRSIRAIVRRNVLTRFNLLLGVLGATIVAVGAIRDALFVVVAVINTAIGVTQEVRARAAVQRLELLAAPVATVVRSEVVVNLDSAAIVLGDVVVVGRGDQIPADGRVVVGAGLEIDESSLTGESDAVAKPVGDLVLSGSAVVAGAGRYVVTAIGAAGFANGLVAAGEAFRPSRSTLRAGLDRILRVVTWLLVPTAVLLIWSQLIANETFGQAVAGTVAGVVSMVPEGLILLTTIALAVGVIRLGRRSVLTRDLNAIEVLSRVDTLYIDKTGTLTCEGLELDDVILVGEHPPTVETGVRDALGALARIEVNRTSTAAALGAAMPDPQWVARSTSPFSSQRKWSGADFGEHGTWIVGAGDVLVTTTAVRQIVDGHAAAGRRALVVGLARRLDGDMLEHFVPVAVVTLREVIKPDAAETLAYLIGQGVDIKVVSGDHPATVAAVARQAGLPIEYVIDARAFVTDADLTAAAVTADVVGRVSPQQKAAIVEYLQACGRTVAMTGDGVNDLLAVKIADVGLAMGSGSPACRAVADMVLLDDGFHALPHIVREGRRVIGNVDRVAKLFLVKTVYAFLLALATGVARLPFPVLPRHLTVVAALTIGIPGFFLALETSNDRVGPGFVRRVVAFAAPAGAVAAVASFVAYADLGSDGATLEQSRTAATIVLFVVGIWAVTAVARPMNVRRIALVATMIVVFVASLAVPWSQHYFGLRMPPIGSYPLVATIAVVAVLAAEFLHRREAAVQRAAERVLKIR